VIIGAKVHNQATWVSGGKMGRAALVNGPFDPSAQRIAA